MSIIKEPTRRVQHYRRLVTVKQAMKECEVTRRTVYNWVVRGQVQWVRTPGGPIRIYADSLYRSPEGIPIDAHAENALDVQEQIEKLF